ncbi:DUF262 domain-containing protein [Chloroflexota bacterium]
MPFEAPITIKEIIDDIHDKKYLLPSIQRAFVWNLEQIELLFDSLLRDYTIGSFLFWHVDKDNKRNYQFYECLRDYHARDRRHNLKADVSGDGDITAIVDGQQRLTALYLGLRGKYAYQLPEKCRDDDSAFPYRMLYLNLLRKNDEPGMEYCLRFLTEEEAEYRDEDTYWFRAGDILDMEEVAEVDNFLLKHRLSSMDGERSQFARETLLNLHSKIFKDRVINYYLEKDSNLDKVLNIYIRVNTAGTAQSYSDLLLAIATAQWKEKDAREEITRFVDEINGTGGGFRFKNDLVLKTCLVMISDFENITFKVDNFNRNNMLKIEKRWDEFSGAIRLAVRFVSSLEYSGSSFIETDALIPISYYLYKKNSPPDFIDSTRYSDDRKNINKWLAICFLNRIFSRQTDEALRQAVEAIKGDYSSFPLEDIVDKLKGTTAHLILNEKDIDVAGRIKFFADPAWLRG